MDQIKIGKFIASLRKENEITQKQLAEIIGVSDKTISKWECGKGLPEMSTIIRLCQALNVNVNEFLSGERLSEDNYSEKAEENIMNLIKETEQSNKKRHNSVITLIVSFAAVILPIEITMLIGTGVKGGAYFIDFPTFLIMLFMTAVLLIITDLWRGFFLAFGIMSGKRKEVTPTELIYAKSAMKLASNTLLATGVLVTITGSVAICFGYGGNTILEQHLETNIAVALLGVLYGIICYLLLLPVRSRLDTY